MFVPLTALGDLLGVLWLLALLLLPVLYIWLRSRGTLGEPPGRGLE